MATQKEEELLKRNLESKKKSSERNTQSIYSLDLTTIQKQNGAKNADLMTSPKKKVKEKFKKINRNQIVRFDFCNYMIKKKKRKMK